MRTVLSLAAIAGALWLLYLGYERQQSLAGRADRSLSRLGAAIDGGDHTPVHMKYFIAGAILLAGGAVGLGVRK